MLYNISDLPKPTTVHSLFRGHEVLRDYAASLGARIVNRTRGSMIDAYERGAE